MVISKAKNNEQIDADILQCKADILRARGAIPSEPAEYEPESQIIAENTTTISTRGDVSAEPEKPGQEKAGIPTFDLAEEIMAEQRKITAIRRKAPGQKTEVQDQEPQVQPISYSTQQSAPGPSEQERIIAEIVARDIERLCRGGV